MPWFPKWIQFPVENCISSASLTTMKWQRQRWRWECVTLLKLFYQLYVCNKFHFISFQHSFNCICYVRAVATSNGIHPVHFWVHQLYINMRKRVKSAFFNWNFWKKFIYFKQKRIEAETSAIDIREAFGGIAKKRRKFYGCDDSVFHILNYSTAFCEMYSRNFIAMQIDHKKWHSKFPLTDTTGKRTNAISLS